jgi:hypothetical protein
MTHAKCAAKDVDSHGASKCEVFLNCLANTFAFSDLDNGIPEIGFPCLMIGMQSNSAEPTAISKQKQTS